METEIEKARESVRKITMGENSASIYFKIILYKDHCDPDIIR
jgi:hypothetical protein